MDLDARKPSHEVIKLFFMLNSAEHELTLLINVKMPTSVGQKCISISLKLSQKKRNLRVAT